MNESHKLYQAVYLLYNLHVSRFYIRIIWILYYIVLTYVVCVRFCGSFIACWSRIKLWLILFNILNVDLLTNQVTCHLLDHRPYSHLILSRHKYLGDFASNICTANDWSWSVMQHWLDHRHLWLQPPHFCSIGSRVLEVG